MGAELFYADGRTDGLTDKIDRHDEGNCRFLQFCEMRLKLKRILGLFNPLNPELNPICYLLALLAHHFLQVSRIRVKSLTLRLLMSYIYIWSAYS